MRISTGSMRLGALFAVMITASSCTVAVEESGPPPLGPGPRVCTREYAPVCARRGRDRETFPNACVAEARGYRVIHPGECRRESGERPPFGPGPRVCTREYAPVCARRGRDRETFPNACVAEARGYRVIHPGECRREGGVRPPFGPGPRVCTQQYDPVCARRGARVRTFGNACEAEVADYRVIHRGPC